MDTLANRAPEALTKGLEGMQRAAAKKLHQPGFNPVPFILTC